MLVLKKGVTKFNLKKKFPKTTGHSSVFANVTQTGVNAEFVGDNFFTCNMNICTAKV